MNLRLDIFKLISYYVSVKKTPVSPLAWAKRFQNLWILNGRFVAHFLFLKKECKLINTNDIQVNEQIRDPEVRVIGEEGEQLGIMSSKEAYFKAKDAGLDLVKISANSTPPVCKIIDFGKYRYELARKEKEKKKNQKVVETKEIRMSPSIDTNDLNTKMNAGRKFLEKGNKLKVTIRFRGREMARTDSAKHLLTDFYENLKEISVIDKEIKLEGRNMSIILSPKK